MTHLEKENELLRQKVAEYEKDFEQIRRVFSKAADQMGLDKVPQEKILVHLIKKIGPRLITSPEKLAEDFSFFSELMPIIQKHYNDASIPE